MVARVDSDSFPGDLEAAGRQILAAAALGGPEASVAMLTEALTQLRQLGPALSGELWDSYAAILAAAASGSPSATITRLPVADTDSDSDSVTN